MNRFTSWTAFAAFAVFALTGSAYAAEDDDLKALVAECGGANVKLDDVDSCLERARVLGEDSPSPQLQGLTARLERLAERNDDDNADLSKTYSVGPAVAGGGGSGTMSAGPVAAPHGNMH